jgi:hypothetical protein
VPLAKPKAESLELELEPLVATLAAVEGEDVLAETVEDGSVNEVDSEVGASTEDEAELVKTLAVGDGPSA